MTKGGVKKIDSIQKRVIELRSMEYEERLEVLGLITLDIRRRRGEMVKIYTTSPDLHLSIIKLIDRCNSLLGGDQYTESDSEFKLN